MPDSPLDMSTTANHRTLTGAGIAVLALLAGCTSVIPGEAASADPVPDAPAVGTCLALDNSDVDKLTIFVDRVACDDPEYTAQVFATPDLTDLGDNPISTYNRSDVEAVIGSTCSEQARDEFLSAESVESPFVQTTFFTPTDTQWALGARWAYCVVSYGLDAVLPAPAVLEGAFSRTPAADYRTCLLLSGFAMVPCSQPHDAEYVGVEIDFGPDPVNPLDDPIRLASALDICLDAFNAYVPQPADPGLDYSVTAPPPEAYDPSVGVQVRCAAYYLDRSVVSTSVRD